MSKYDRLSEHLQRLNQSEWRASFREIEGILGGHLPDSARKYPAWWSNQTGGGHSQSESWQKAGWRTGELDLAGEKVIFMREVKYKTRLDSFDVTSAVPVIRSYDPDRSGKAAGLTIAEAKSGLAAHFGVPIESIEITIKG